MSEERSNGVPPPIHLLSQAIMLVEQADGDFNSYIVSNLTEYWRINNAADYSTNIGGEGLSDVSAVATIELAGEYSVLFSRLASFAERNEENKEGVTVLSGRLLLFLVPNVAEETHGIFGTREAHGKYRLVLFPSKAHGRKLLAALRDESFADDVREVLPTLERSTLPEDSATDVVELNEDLAWWIAWWYALYRHTTGKLI